MEYTLRITYSNGENLYWLCLVDRLGVRPHLTGFKDISYLFIDVDKTQVDGVIDTINRILPESKRIGGEDLPRVEMMPALNSRRVA